MTVKLPTPSSPPRRRKASLTDYIRRPSPRASKKSNKQEVQENQKVVYPPAESNQSKKAKVYEIAEEAFHRVKSRAKDTKKVTLQMLKRLIMQEIEEGIGENVDQIASSLMSHFAQVGPSR